MQKKWIISASKQITAYRYHENAMNEKTVPIDLKFPYEREIEFSLRFGTEFHLAHMWSLRNFYASLCEIF